MTQPTASLNRQRRIDWQRILANLHAVGMSMQQIADAVEVGKSTLYGYVNEDATSEPAYWVGHCLVVLWCARCGCQLEDVPIKHVPLSISAIMKSFD